MKKVTYYSLLLARISSFSFKIKPWVDFNNSNNPLDYYLIMIKKHFVKEVLIIFFIYLSQMLHVTICFVKKLTRSVRAFSFVING